MGSGWWYRASVLLPASRALASPSPSCGGPYITGPQTRNMTRSRELRSIAIDKLTQILQGKNLPIHPKPPTLDWNKPKERIREKEEASYTKDVDINDVKARYMLTKEDAQRRIMNESGAKYVHCCMGKWSRRWEALGALRHTMPSSPNEN